MKKIYLPFIKILTLSIAIILLEERGGSAVGISVAGIVTSLSANVEAAYEVTNAFFGAISVFTFMYFCPAGHRVLPEWQPRILHHCVWLTSDRLM